MTVRSFAQFLDYYDRVRQRTSRLVNIIPEDVFDWAYRPGKFTIGDQVRHIAAMERFMFAENALRHKCTYTGCGKDLADGKDAIIAFFNEMHVQSMAIFRGLDETALNTKCPNPGGEITTWKWLRAMAEHEIHHRGELYIYLNLIGVETPPMFGVSAELVIELSR